MAHDLLYPGRPYASLVKHERFRITELARRLAGIPYNTEPPPLDDEILTILDNAQPPPIDARNQYLLTL